jgi:hypothetical protein
VWVPLAELSEGETLQGSDGPAIVLSVSLSRVSQPVYNVEVHNEHVYQVGEIGVLVHNSCFDDAPKGKYRGGLHGSTKGPVGDGLESHHMPAKSVNGLHPDKGPAIQMDPADHALTASHGTQPGSDIYRLRQLRLINQGKFGEAIQMDIDNVRKLFGNKYDEAIREMIDQLEPWMKKGISG